jgi:predicted Zn-dependent protease
MYTANLEVNFLNNPNYVDQNWEKSIDLFKSMTRDYPFQIFGWYMLMKSYEGAGHAKEAQAAEQKIYDWIEKDERAADIYNKYGHYLDAIKYEPTEARSLTN